MADELTARSTIGAWLAHPVGGPIVRRHLARAGVDEAVVAPFKLLPLETAAGMSGGRLTRDMIDGLLAEVERAG